MCSSRSSSSSSSSSSSANYGFVGNGVNVSASSAARMMKNGAAMKSGLGTTSTGAGRGLLPSVFGLGTGNGFTYGIKNNLGS